MLDKLVLKLKNSIVKDLEQTLEELKEVLLASSSFYNDVILHQSNFSDTTRKVHQGVLSDKEAKITFAQIRMAVLYVLDNLEEADVIDLSGRSDLEHVQATTDVSNTQASRPDLGFKDVVELEKQMLMLSSKKEKLQSRYLLLEDQSSEEAKKLEPQIATLETEIQGIKKLLASKYNLYTEEGQTLLEAKIKELNIEESIGIIHRVNCNREGMRDRFWDAFDELEEDFFQFYFITACNTQMPHSFAERMVYELIHEELDDTDEAIHCLRKADTQRVRIFDLPLKRNLDKSQNQFKAFFAEYFEFKTEETFDHYLETGLPKLSYEYVVMVFEIHERKWKDFIPQYFQWVIDSFTNTHDAIPRFLFFFVIYVDNLHLKGQQTAKQTALIDSLKKLAEANEGATHLSPLLPVPIADLKAWMIDLGERDEGRIQTVIDLLVKGLRPNVRILFDKDQQFNMSDVERLQEIICNHNS